MRQLEHGYEQLREWPRRVAAEHRLLAKDVLERCCRIFRSNLAVLLVDDGDEPWLSIGVRDAGEFTWTEDEDLSLEGALAEHLVLTSVILDDVKMIQAVDARIRRLIGTGAVLSVGIPGDSIQSHLFVCDPKLDADTALAIAYPIAALIGVQLEATAELQRAVRTAVTEERVRVARDLHDGLLQSFTGVVLQLETIHSTLESDPQDARRMITETQALIMSDQRDLRRFVEQLRPRPTAGETKFDFTARLEDLRSRFANQWGIHLAFDVANVDPLVSSLIGQETFRLIHEAVTNSAKHGRASDVHVGVRTDGSEMQIEVTDNGTGFPFHGRLTLDEMRRSGNGPTVLAERVSSLNGSLVVDSTETGATVRMTVPLGFGA
jgi:signal transduction histidine kinase